MSGKSRFFIFALVGGFAGAVNIVARILFSLVIPYEIAIVLAFPIALTVAFLLNRAYVFRTGGNRAAQFGRFTIVNLAALAQVWLVSVSLARFVFPAFGGVWHGDILAHTIGVISPIATSYFAHKRFTFR